jgi:hypothetical protein
MTGVRSTLRVLLVLGCVVGLSAATARADAVTVGALGNAPGDGLLFSYNTLAPLVEIGSPGVGIPMAYDPDEGPLVKVFQVTNPRYHHLHIVEHIEVVGETSVEDWNEVLMVSNGEGGWTPSGNFDDLWFSCYYRGTPEITPWPEVTPEPSGLDVTNTPMDLLSILWDEPVNVGTIITVDRWVTVPAGISAFAIYHYTQSEGAVAPEPATMSLLGIGLGVLVVRKLKH